MYSLSIAVADQNYTIVDATRLVSIHDLRSEIEYRTDFPILMCGISPFLIRVHNERSLTESNAAASLGLSSTGSGFLFCCFISTTYFLINRWDKVL